MAEIPRRRSRGQGSIYYHATKHCWAAAYIEAASGRRRTLYAPTEAMASQRLRAALGAEEAGLHPDSGMRVAHYLRDYLAARTNDLDVSTHQRYEELLRLHAIPFIGHLSLDRLTGDQLDRLYQDRLAHGGRSGGRLSRATVHQLHVVLRSAFGKAVAKRLLTYNPCDGTTPPRAATEERTVLDGAQLQALVDDAAGTVWYALYAMAALTGMRLGELLALTWARLDLEAGYVAVVRSIRRLPGQGLVEKNVKTHRSRRTVRLPEVVIAALRDHRRLQAAMREAAGAAWVDRDLVFTAATGTPLDGSNLLRREHYPRLARLGLPHIRFHDLRHSAITQLLAMGVDASEVQDVAGHASSDFTKSRYGHHRRVGEKAAAAMDAAFGAPTSEDASPPPAAWHLRVLPGGLAGAS